MPSKILVFEGISYINRSYYQLLKSIGFQPFMS